MNISFKAKYIIHFDILCKTGLHIGGGSTGSRIGLLDSPVIKDPLTDYPVIAGSSLKGRTRERLEWIHMDEKGKNAISKQLVMDDKTKKVNFSKVGHCTCGECDICRYFGHSTKSKSDKAVIAPTRLLFRDAFPKITDDHNQIQIWQEYLGQGVFTEEKTENTISRLTAESNPRQIERVPSGSIFSGEIVLDLYTIEVDGIDDKDNVQDALSLLFKGLAAIEDSYLGGNGSRGSGVVTFKHFHFTKYDAEYYENPEKESSHFALDDLDANQIFKTKKYVKLITDN